MSRPVRVRFAPSPTGPLHIGGVRTALYNYLFAKQNQGSFILRVEDTDQNRFVQGAEDYILEALNWLGISPDEGVGVGGEFAPYRQSERKDMYAQFAYQLVEAGYAYYAFDTSEELTDMRTKLQASNMSAKYDHASRMSMKNSLTLSEDEVKSRLDNGDDFVIRIKLPRNEEIRFHDIIRGWVVFNSSQLDDKVLLKGDGMPTYHLANIVDDYHMNISHVIRGEEWLPSAPLHVMLYKYLGWEEKMPEFAHLPLLLKPDGNGKLSKRDGDRLGFPVFPLNWTDPTTGEVSSGYREQGYQKEAVINMLAFLGWHPSDNKELFSLSELIDAFSLERVSKSGAKFDLDKAKWFNHQFLMRESNEAIYTEIEEQLTENQRANKPVMLKVIEMLKEKVNFASELVEQSSYFFDMPAVYDEKVKSKKWDDATANLLSEFAQHLKDSNATTAAEIEVGLDQFAEKKEISKGKLMQPLRWAVSGLAGGPPIYDMLEVIGIEQIEKRIEKAKEML